MEIIIHNGWDHDRILSDMVEVSSPASPAVQLQVARNPNKTAYLEGEDFDPEGMIIWLCGQDGQAQEVSDYVILDGTGLTSEDREIIICRGTLKVQIPIQVYACTGLEITTPPDRTTYQEGELLDPSGMEVSLVYENGERKEISDYTVENKTLTPSDNQVLIRYEAWEVRLALTVLEASVPDKGQEEAPVEQVPDQTQPVPKEPSSESGETKEEPEPVKVQSIKLKAGGILLAGKKLVLGRGEKVKLSTVVQPSNADPGNITFRSTNKKVVSVGADGTIKGKKKGSVKIKVTAANGKAVTLRVTGKKAPSRLLLKTEKKTLKGTEKFKIQTKLPKGTASYTLTYKSSKPKVVSVNRRGMVTVKKKGSAVITVTTYNKKKLRFRVTVKERRIYVNR